MSRVKISPAFHGNFQLFTILLLVVGVVCSKFLMSLGLLFGGIGFLLERDFKNYWLQLKSNRLFWFLAAFYLLHFVGLLWSKNLDYGLNDIRVKFSLFAIALIICTRPPFTKNQLTVFYLIFVLSLFVTSLVNFLCYQFFQDKIEYIDIRDLSLFGSHIRFGILIALGVLANYFLWNLKSNFRWVWLITALWFAFYTYYSQVLSGVISIAVVVFVLLLWELYQRRNWMVIIGTLLLLLAVKIGLLVYLSKPINQNSVFPENYVSLKQEWNKRAKIPYDSLDLRKQELKFTLERYLISKNLPVRGDGVAKLSVSDIQNIEKGYADINETKSGLMARLYGLRFQIHHSQNPSGHSLLERLEYWKTALLIIKENLLIGVGTGDVNDSFLNKYEETNSPLTEERRLRAHNTYLTETVSFGIIGFLFFIAWMLYFLYQQIKFQQVFGVVFILVAIVTFVIEDTLETQMGVTFFALFYAVFSRKMTEGEMDTSTGSV
ncbi:MAG: hypothetical protein FGM14_04755 [Flavobacteriales bacterium]|nr:hypothetical protein [Flavobacteriales bacterium]